MFANMSTGEDEYVVSNVFNRYHSLLHICLLYSSDTVLFILTA